MGCFATAPLPKHHFLGLLSVPGECLFYPLDKAHEVEDGLKPCDHHKQARHLPPRALAVLHNVALDALIDLQPMVPVVCSPNKLLIQLAFMNHTRGGPACDMLFLGQRSASGDVTCLLGMRTRDRVGRVEELRIYYSSGYISYMMVT